MRSSFHGIALPTLNKIGYTKIEGNKLADIRVRAQTKHHFTDFFCHCGIKQQQGLYTFYIETTQKKHHVKSCDRETIGPGPKTSITTTHSAQCSLSSWKIRVKNPWRFKGLGSSLKLTAFSHLKIWLALSREFGNESPIYQCKG